MSGRTTSALRRLNQAGQPDLARRLDRFFAAVAAQAAANEQFATSLFAALDDESAPVGRSAEASLTRRRAGGRRPPGPFDPFAVLGAHGPEVLRQRLGQCEIDELKNIVAEHGMDHDRLAMRWKKPDRLIERIIETVEAQERKGEAFR